MISDSQVQQMFHFLDNYSVASHAFDWQCRPGDDKQVLLEQEEVQDSVSFSSSSGHSVVEASGTQLSYFSAW